MHTPKTSRKRFQPKRLAQPSTLTPHQLLQFFLQLLPLKLLRQLSAAHGKRFYHRLFTPLVTLWYLLFQRLNPDHSLEAVLTDAQAGGADRLNRKLSCKLRSNSTGSYSDARQRLPLEFLTSALCLQAQNLSRLSPTTRWKGWVLALLDGSTVRLRPYGNLAQELPPNPNQYPGRAYWCLMRVVVCLCALSGAALDCALGSIHLSEQALACEMMLRCLGQCLFIGDSNFGVFRIVQTARHAGQQVLVRLTKRRARKILGRSLVQGDHAVLWKPSRKDQLQPACSPEPLEGRLLIQSLRRKGFRPLQLCLFTTLPSTADYALMELVRLYGLRWHAELNLRYLKDQMDLAQLDVRSAAMARKEWLAGLLAYNLIRAAQLCAALHQKLDPLALSFSSVRRRLEQWLKDFARTQTPLGDSWAKLLECMARCRLPRPTQARPNEPRAQRHLRSPYKLLYGSRATARRHLKKYASKS